MEEFGFSVSDQCVRYLRGFPSIQIEVGFAFQSDPHNHADRVYAAALSILPSAFIYSLFCSYFATHPFISLNPCGCGRRLQTDATDVLTTLVANGTCPAQNEGAYIFSNCPVRPS